MEDRDEKREPAERLETILALHMAKCIQVYDLQDSMHRVARVFRDQNQAGGSVTFAGFGDSRTDKDVTKAFNDIIKKRFPDRLTGAGDSMAVAFLHTILEETLHECLRFTYEMDSAPWFEDWKGAKIEYGRIAGLSQDSVNEVVGNERLDSLFRNESLEKKIAKLKKICYGQASRDDRAFFERHYKIDSAALRQFDQLRHRKIHGLEFFNACPEFHAHFELVLQAGAYLVQLAKLGFNVRSSNESFANTIEKVFSAEF